MGSLLASAPVSTESVPTYGPSALGGSAKRFIELTLTMARTEFKLRYFGSVLGYFWSLIRPLLFFGVIYVFFTQIVDVGKGVPHYGVYLLTGIVLWTYFGEATGTCVQALRSREGVLRKVRFPRMVIPLSVCLTSVFNLAMNSIAVVVFALANGVSPRLSWLEMLPIAGGFIVLATGLGMLLSALYVRYRDVQPIWEVLLQVLFYASPIMYVASAYHRFEHAVLTLNPIALLLTQMGYAFVHPDPDSDRDHARVVHSHQPDGPRLAAICRDPSGDPTPAAHALGTRGERRALARARVALVDPADLPGGVVGLHPRGATGSREHLAGSAADRRWSVSAHQTVEDRSQAIAELDSGAPTEFTGGAGDVETAAGDLTRALRHKHRLGQMQ